MSVDEQYQIHLQQLKHKSPGFVETIYALGNGHLGVRASNPLQGNSPAYPGTPGLLVNGFYDLSPIQYGEAYFGYAHNNQTICELPDPRYLIFSVDGVRSDQTAYQVEMIDKTWDMASGLLLETFHVTMPTAKKFALTMESFASQADRHLYVVRYDVRALNFSGPLTIIKQHDYVDQQIPRGAEDVRRAQRGNTLIQTYLPSTAPTMQFSTQKSQLGLLMTMEYLGSDPRVQLNAHANVPNYEIQLELTPDRSAQFTFGYSLGEIHNLLAFKLNQTHYIDKSLARLKNRTFSDLFTASAARTQQFWQDSDVIIEGDPILQKGIRFNLYHLYQAAGRDHRTDIPAKGLTGSGYEGHYFWDTEMYMLPFFIYTQPKIAKALLSYRYATLGAAGQRAREMAIKSGALFPWRTINGEEASAYFPAGTAQVHINADIAYATDQYIRATNDTDFLISAGFELILETARFWLAYGNYGEHGPQAGHFVINRVTGPDEYTALIDNNYYTNRMAQHNMRLAVKYAVKLQQLAPDKLTELAVTDEEIANFKQAAADMYLPYDEKHQIKLQDDNALNRPRFDIENEPAANFPLLLHYHPLVLYRYQVNKQADTLMSDFLFPLDQDQAQLRRDYNYYEGITTHDSSLSRAIFSILANRIDDSKKAQAYFMDTALTDLTDLQGNSEDGIHAANMGGSWLSLVYGFAGMHFGMEGLTFAPQLPASWFRLSFKIKYRNRQLDVDINQETARFILLSGAPLTIYCQQQACDLSQDMPVTVPLKNA
ncbi:glycoside hydrolase family 65 protein [Loigolactobacillus zhaoyuanensis]|uniref:glycoside hydrolase family 65 protein n=1 Tax=Loigolactobacillus zhaoyuanensis TaxID=2486017 RepID=UPI000F73D56E|nr:glycosyl hydrolase family 65 protein [Loigolactobacillus zhaoyuanensis]